MIICIHDHDSRADLKKKSKTRHCGMFSAECTAVMTSAADVEECFLAVDPHYL